jgi:pyridine nucleotide-disulfide oxidoreductase domain-containing protein 1
VIKDDYIGNTFFDASASEFFLKSLEIQDTMDDNSYGDSSTRMPQFESVPAIIKTDFSIRDGRYGSSMGPNWIHTFEDLYYNKMDDENGSPSNSSGKTHAKLSNVDIHYSCSIVDIEYFLENRDAFPIRVQLSDGSTVECDFIVSATGVLANVGFVGDEIPRAQDGSLLVDAFMKTSVDNVYAAGDCCSIEKNPSNLNCWFQMRLWSQARNMGILAAYSMCQQAITMDGETLRLSLDPPIGPAFEIFSHATSFFGFKVILLGLYNGQGLMPTEYQAFVRCILGKEYIKLIMKEGRAQGALLIGDTNLEETFENLILTQLDLSGYGDEILDPSIDIEDYFD